MLNIVGIETYICYNGQEAVDHIKSLGNVIPYHLILMDINMPVLDGVEVI